MENFKNILLVFDPKSKIQAAREHAESLAKSKKIDLLVMGTVCRTGVAGLLIGNTAEKVLNDVDCSVLAIKPPGFKTPVRLED